MKKDEVFKLTPKGWFVVNLGDRGEELYSLFSDFVKLRACEDSESTNGVPALIFKDGSECVLVQTKTK